MCHGKASLCGENSSSKNAQLGEDSANRWKDGSNILSQAPGRVIFTERLGPRPNEIKRAWLAGRDDSHGSIGMAVDSANYLIRLIICLNYDKVHMSLDQSLVAFESYHTLVPTLKYPVPSSGYTHLFLH